MDLLSVFFTTVSKEISKTYNFGCSVTSWDQFYQATRRM